MRPFFLTSDGAKARPAKKYYDYFSVLVTQATFSFVVAPFIYLTIEDSLRVWSRVYFYCIIGVAACYGFLNSPGKAWLKNKLKQRNAMALQKKNEKTDTDFPALGMPENPIEELKGMVNDISKGSENILASKKGS